MNSMSSPHETDVPVESTDRYSGSHRADMDNDSVAEPISVVEEDVVVIETHDAGDDPDMHDAEYRDSTAASETIVPASADDRELSSWPASGGPSADTERWSEIKAMFVDDPAESVKLASGMVEHAIENLMASLRQRHESLASSDAHNSAGTEELRNALRGCRSLFEQLEGISAQLRAGSGTGE
ncbi:MAG: hypothetical protein ACTHJW_16300 [Streptosporangiaceae bacterium]